MHNWIFFSNYSTYIYTIIFYCYIYSVGCSNYIVIHTRA